MLCAPITAPSDDAALLIRYRDEDDREALAELVRRHADAAFGVARRFLGHASDAEEAVQEALVQLLRGARTFRRGSPFRPWFLRLVVNACKMQRRGAARRRAHELAAGRAMTTSTDRAADDLHEALGRALAELDEPFRLAVQLRYLDGLPFPDVAAALGVPEKTARSRVGRGLERLRRSVASHGRVIGVGVLAETLARGAVPDAAPATLVDRLAAAARSRARLPRGSTATALLRVAPFAIAATLSIALWAAHRGSTPADPPPTAPQDVLDQRLDARLAHDDLEVALAIITRALPAANRPRFAYPDDLEQPWTGATWPTDDAGPRTVRAAFDAIAADLGLRWEARGDLIAWSKPATATERAALESESTKDDAIVAACRRDLALVERAARSALRRPWDQAFLAHNVVNLACKPDWPAGGRLALGAALRGDDDLRPAVRAILAQRAPDSRAPIAATLAGVLADQACVPDLSRLVRARATATGTWWTQFEYQAATRALGLIGSTAAVDALLRTLDDASVPDERAGQALEALTRTGDARAVAALERTARQAIRPELRRTAVEGLAGIDEAAATDALLRLAMLQGEDRDVAAVAAIAAARRGRIDAVRTVLERCADLRRDAPASALDAALAAADRPLIAEFLARELPIDPRFAVRALAWPDAARRILADLLAEPDPIRRNAARLLAATRDDAALAALLRRYDDGDAAARGAIGPALAWSSDPRATEIVRRTLADERVDPAARTAALAGLVGRLRDPGLLAAVIERARHDRSIEVREVAVAALRGHPAAEALAAIEGLVADPEPRIRGLALTIAGVRGGSARPDPTAIRRCDALLLASVADPHAFVRASALFALGCVHRDGMFDGTPIDPAIAGALRAALAADPHRDVRRIAATALADDPRTAETVRALLASAAQDPDADVRAAAANALGTAMLARNDGRGTVAPALTAQLARETDAGVRRAIDATLHVELRAAIQLRSPLWSETDEVVLAPVSQN